MTELVRTYKLTDSGAWGWVTEEAEGGGGGSLPSWWTVDSTPGSESVEFAGAVTISPSEGGGNLYPLEIVPPADLVDNSYIALRIQRPGGSANNQEDLFNVEADGTIYVIATPGQGAGQSGLYLKDDAPGGSAIRNGLIRQLAGGDLIAWTLEAPVALGFFGATPVEKPTGVAATGPGVHAALVSLGLIAA